MTDKPQVFDVVAGMFAERTIDDIAAKARATLRCGKCQTRLGIVVATPHGPAWIGFLHHRKRRKVRDQLGVPGVNIAPYWVEAWRPYYIAECGCARNAVSGSRVWDATQTGRDDSEVPPQQP